ncbi:MAG: DNA polymerase III subunit delta [Planctomycetaceae bacterium]|nr:DNA polymerase III subunit delta [Planctomycetaceae bacterium]
MAAKQKKTQPQPGLLVIFGEDPFLVAQQCDKCINELLSPEEKAMALYEPKADTVEVVDVLDELRTVPFLASRRVVLIKDAEPFIKNNTGPLEKYLDSPSPSGVLVMTVTSWDKRLRFSKKVQAAGCLLEVGNFKAFQLPAYVASYAQQAYGIRLDSSCSGLLVELVGDDPGRLCREMDKLAIFVAPAKTVTTRDIESLIGHNRVFGAFQVIDSILAQDMGAAVSRLDNMFSSDKDADYTVVGAFGYHFRKLFRVKALVTKGTPAAAAADRCGVRYNQKQDFLRQADALSLEQIGSVLAELGRIDYGIKSGQTTAPIAMERLIMRVFSMQKADK